MILSANSAFFCAKICLDMLMTNISLETKPLLQTAISAVQAGQPEVARVLLETVLVYEERNELAWLWLSAVVNSDEERQLCFDNVLAINPNNQAARQRVPPTEAHLLRTAARFRSPPLRWLLTGLVGLVLFCASLVGLGLTVFQFYDISGQLATLASLFSPIFSASPVTPPLELTVQAGPPVLYPGWTNFTNGNEILDLYLHDEILWAATAGGLVRWNIAERSYLKYTSEHGLPGNRLRRVGADTGGRLWIGTELHGLYVGDGQTWERWPQFDDPRLALPQVLFQDSRGNIWAGRTALARFDGATWQWFDGLLPDTRSGTNIANAIFEDSRGNIWVGANQLLLRYDGTSWQSWTPTASLGELSVLTIAQEPTGALLLGTTAGLLRFDPEARLDSAWQAFESTVGLPGTPISLLFIDHAGKIWAGVRYSIERRNGNRTTTTSAVALAGYDGIGWHTVPGLGENSVTDIVQDKVGNLWVGTTGGLFQFDGSKWQPWPIQDGLAGNEVSSLVLDRAGRLWFGTSSGVSVFNPQTSPDTFHVLPSPGGPPEGKRVELNWQIIPGTQGDSGLKTNLFIDRDGKVWVSSRESNVIWFDGETWHHFSQDDVTSGNLDAVQTMFQDNTNHMWFVSTWGEVIEYDGQGWRSIPALERDQAFSEPKQFIRDAAGDIWAVGYEHLWRYDGSTWETSPLPNSHHGGRLALGPEGALWLTTSQSYFVSSLWRYDGSTWQPMALLPGGPASYGDWLFFDRAGGMWLATQDELFWYDGHRWHRFGLADSGLASLSITAMLEDVEGNLWIATTGGVSRLNLDEVR